MNPQSISSSFLIATGHVRAMRGGAQSHMLTASDGHAYVVKFANNPQSVHVLANEWIASSIGRALGLTIPEPAILYVPASLVENSPSLVIRLSSATLKCSHGLAFGSRVISGDEVFDYLPESLFERIENRQEFFGAFALDKWLCNCDGRQMLFCRREPDRNFRAHFIDFGYCFNAEEWAFPDTTTRGIYARRCVYQDVCGWQSFEPWLSRIESFDLLKLWEIAADVPREWADPEILAQLIECIYARRNRVRELIAAVRQSPHNPFGAWTEQQP
ncbi:MAG: HipA family kinase [Terriglobales bacterium]